LHIIHLAAKHFLEDVCPTPSKFKKQGRTDEPPHEDGSEKDRDLLSKLIAFVNQVYTVYHVISVI
jgi:hypothetical protein